MFGLARFGLGLLGDAAAGGHRRPGSTSRLLLRALFDPDAAPAEPETWVFERPATAGIRDRGRRAVPAWDRRRRRADELTARFSGDAATLVRPRGRDAWTLRRRWPTGDCSVEGDERALERMRAAFPVPRRSRAYS